METEAIQAPQSANYETCKARMRPILDTMEVLSGRWKLPILLALIMGNRRFKQISKDVSGISDKVLSKELKDLEMNQLITRTVYETFPPTVEYAITPHGQSLQKVIFELGSWGVEHRKKIIGDGNHPGVSVTCWEVPKNQSPDN